MENQSERTVNPEDVKKQLEAIVGHEIDISAEQLIRFWVPISTQDYADGTALWRSIIFPRESCNAATLLDVSGVSSTGADGKRVFLLSDFACLPLVRSLAEPINLLATPRSTNPFFVTTTHALVPDATDVQMTVFAWSPTGAAAPNVTFDWRCRVVSNPIIV
ncbi:MAG TPA: hypothetical protein VF221_12855 [Chloroflexota bacterium]